MDRPELARLGFDDARRRLEASYDRPGGADSDRALIAIVEAVMWACSLDDIRHDDPGYVALRERHDGGLCVHGVRLARNLGVHEVVELKQMGSGWSYPRSYPRRFNSWRWLSFDRLPPSTQRQRRGVEDAYRDHLGGREVDTTLALIGQLFDADTEQRRSE